VNRTLVSRTARAAVDVLSIGLAVLFAPQRAMAHAAADFRAELARRLLPSVTISGARLDVVGLEPALPSSCQLEEVTPQAPISTSGRVAVRLSGRGCPPWVWARLELRAPVFVTSRAVRPHERLAAALTRDERLVIGAPATSVAPGALAARALPAGAVLRAGDVADARPAAGSAVEIVARVGALEVVTKGALVPCTHDATCAVTPTGQHVRGRLEGNRLVVETP
jgi:hypothetical protein